MNTRHAASRQPRGFTLFEIIIAIAIMVMVAGVLGAAINAAFTLKRSAENAVSATQDTAIMGDIFVKDVQSALQPSSYSANDPNAASGSVMMTETPYYMAQPFQGTTDNLQFCTTGIEPRSRVHSDVRWVEFTLTPLQDGTMAFVRHQKTNLLEDTATDPDQEILAVDVLGVQFRYWDGSAWQTEWDSVSNGNVLPYGVAMELTLKPLRESDPPRIVKRFAACICVAPSTQNSGTTGGIQQ